MGRFGKPTEEVAKVSNIVSSASLMKEASEKIKRFQQGTEIPIRTRYHHFNDNLLGGLFNGTIVTIAGLSSFGKTTILKHIESDIFNKSLNSHCDDVVLLKCNYEMTAFNLLLRRLKEETKTPMKKLLSEVPTSDEEKEFQRVVDLESHPNVYYIEKALLPREWYEEVRAFILNHVEKKSIVISIDHLGLVKDTGNKKQAMDDTLEFQNELKKEFSNVIFLNLSQLNRDIETRTDVKHMMPKASDLYNSSNIMFISDLVLIIHNPFKLGIDKYMVFPTSRYPHLKEFMVDPKRDRTSFDTKNAVMWHYVKIRQDDKDPEDDKDNTLYIERLYKERVPRTPLSELERIEATFTLPRMVPNNKDIWDETPTTDDNDDEDDYPF